MMERKIDESRCKKIIRKGEMWHTYGEQCARKPWQDGWCKQHHPESVKAKQEESTKRYKEKWNNSPQMQLIAARERIATLEAQLQRWQTFHSTECNTYLDDESDSVLGDYQLCTCGAPKLVQEINRLSAMIAEARERIAALEAERAADCRAAYLQGWNSYADVDYEAAEEAERLWPSAGKAEGGMA